MNRTNMNVYLENPDAILDEEAWVDAFRWERTIFVCSGGLDMSRRGEVLKEKNGGKCAASALCLVMDKARQRRLGAV